MKLGTKWFSRVLISNLTIAFVNSFPKITFGADLAPKLQTALFKIKCSTTEYSRGLISNSTIHILNFVPNIPFSVNLVPKIQNPLS